MIFDDPLYLLDFVSVTFHITYPFDTRAILGWRHVKIANSEM